MIARPSRASAGSWAWAPGSMRAAGLTSTRSGATGGFARSQLWRQMLADALGVSIQFPEGR